MPIELARPNSKCFVCGNENPNGLKIRYEADSSGVITARWKPSRMWEGFEGIIHGGIITTVLDEAMSKAVAAARCRALTCELNVRLRHYVPAGVTLRIQGWIVARQKRKIATEAALFAASGEEWAHAWATFLALPETAVGPAVSASPENVRREAEERRTEHESSSSKR